MLFRLLTIGLFGLVFSVQNSSAQQNRSLNQNKGLIENVGQIANANHEVLDSIDFKLEQTGINAYISPTGIIYHMYHTEKKTYAEMSDDEKAAYDRGDLNESGEKVYFYRLDFKLIGANSDAKVEKFDELEFKSNYYLAHCLDGITGVSSYSKVVYKDIYDNIDLVYRLDGQQLKYEFIVHPGGDPNDINFTYDGASELIANSEGLNVVNGYRSFRENQPYTFYRDEEETINSAFSVNDKLVSFEIGDYDKNREIVIDPTIVWATHQNNGGGADFHANGAFDSNENMYFAYATYSATWPVINAGAGQYYDATRDGSADVVIIRYNANFSQQWATYFGGDGSDFLCGTGGDYGKTIDVDDNDDIYIAGHCNASPSTFPTLDAGGSAWYQDQSNLKGGDNSYVAKFNPNGVLQWSTLYQHTNAGTGGAGIRINGIVCQGTRVYFTGQTYQFSGYDIPFVNLAGAYNNTTFHGDQGIFLGRFNSNCVLEWSTYFNSGATGGSSSYLQGSDLTFDSNGNMILVGQISGDPTPAYLLNPGGGAYFQNTVSGFIDHIITKFNTSLQPTWSTLFGGTDLDRVSEVSTDPSNNILIAVRTARVGNPTANPGGGAFYYPTLQYTGGGTFSQDGFIMKFSPNGVYTWGTYVGGSAGESTITGIASDDVGNIYAIGHTFANNFPTQTLAGSYNQSTLSGTSSDLVLMRFTSGGVNEWSTFYGGNASDNCYGTKIRPSTISSSCGYKQVFSLRSQSTNFPTVDPGGSAFFEGTITGTSANTLLYIEEAGAGGSSEPTAIAVTQPVGNCAGENVTLTATGQTVVAGDQLVWYEGGCGSGASIGTGASIVVAPTSNTTYYVRVEGPCGNTACESVTVNVVGTGTEDASWTSPGTICEAAGSINLNPLITGDAGGTWSGTGVSGNTFNPSGLSGSINVTYTVGTSPCEEAVTQAINVLPDVNPVWSAPTTVCESGGTVNLNTYLGSATSGGTWSGTGVSGNNFNPAGLSGSISITYTVGSAPCQESSAQSITVEPDVDPSWTDPSPVCESGGTVNLNGLITGTPGGTWSGTGVSGSTFDPSGLSGTINITYTVGNGICEETNVIGVTITSTPSPSWTTPGTICEAAGTINLDATITGTTGGSWSGTGVSGSTFDPSGLTGSVSITYSVGSGACLQTLAQNITVTPDVDPSWTNPGTICDGSGTVNLNGLITGTPGGTWSGTGVTGSTFDPSGLSGQTISITYDIGTSPCDESLTQSITVQSTVTATWTNPGTICGGGGLIDLSTYITGSTGGTFTGSGVSGNMFDPSALSGNVTITYSVGTGACSDAQAQTINVIPDVDPSWTNPSPVCVSNGSIDLSTLVTGTAGGTWSGTGVSGTTFDPTGLGGQSILITYLVGTAPCQEQEVLTVNVTNTVSAAWTAPASVCESDAAIDLSTLITGDAGGTFSGSGISGNMFDPAGLSGSVSITYTVGTAPCQDTQVSSINILSAPNAPTVTAVNDTICAGDTTTIDASGSGASIVYNVYDALTGGTLIGQTPLVVQPTATTSYFIEAVNANNCANNGGRIEIEIVVNPLPIAEAGVNETICPGDSVSLTASGGSSYLWNTGDMTASITVSPSTDTYYYVSVDDGNCTAMDSVLVSVVSVGSIDAVDDIVSVPSNQTSSIDYGLNDTGNPNNAQIYIPPVNGNANIVGGILDYTPSSGFIGNDSIVYILCDASCGSICDTATIYITIEEDIEIRVPNGVTPNGDGVNDVLVINGLSQFEHELLIYSRWGDLIFNASPYNNDWNGQSQSATYGDKVVDGTYFYILTYTNANGEDVKLNGFIEVKSK